MLALIIVVVFISPILGENLTASLPVHPEYGNTADIGLTLFTKYIAPFEVAAIMLLVAMIGGIVLAGKKMEVSYSDMSEEEIDAHRWGAENTRWAADTNKRIWEDAMGEMEVDENEWYEYR